MENVQTVRCLDSAYSARHLRHVPHCLGDRLPKFAMNVLMAPVNKMAPISSRFACALFSRRWFARKVDGDHPCQPIKYRATLNMVETAALKEFGTWESAPEPFRSQHLAPLMGPINGEGDSQHIYLRFQDYLRARLSDSDEPQMERLAQALWEAPGLSDFVEALVGRYLDRAGFVPSDDLAKDLSLAWETLAELPEEHWSSSKGPAWRQLAEKFYLYFDPVGCGNVPYAVFDLTDGERSVKVYRNPCPTEEGVVRGTWSRPRPIPEFQALVRLTEARKHRHVYVNMQYRRGRGEQKNERLRSEVLEGMNSEALLVVSLDKNSLFYQQKGKYRHRNRASKFKKELLEQILAREGGYYFPPALSKKIESHLPQCMDWVHSTFFGSRERLTRAERKDFVELLYLLILDDIMLLEGPESLSLACKSCVDRGATALAAYFLYQGIKQGVHKESGFRSRLMGILFGPALFVGGRLPRETQLKRFFSLCERLLGEEEWVESLEVAPLAATEVAVRGYRVPAD